MSASRDCSWPGIVAALSVATFAFLLASFPARNSDLWMYLAAGRDLVNGRAPADWISSSRTLAPPNQTWLYDLAAYCVFSVAGGAGLVVAKALLVGGTAVILLKLSRTGPGWWVPVVSTGLAALAIGARVPLQPVTISYFLLAVALGFLRPGSALPARPSFMPPWRLAILFLVWVNMDRWFVLGLATVALVWLGRTLDGAQPDCVGGVARRAGSALVRVAVLCAVCLLNPIHIHAFAMPAGFGWPGAAALATDSGLPSVVSPFQRPYLTTVAATPAGLAYFPLLGLSLVSFALAWPRWRWEWFLPWLGLAVASGLQARAIPFFAVVAGPVLAWNLQNYFGRRGTAGRKRGAWAVRTGAGVFGLTFLAGAWAGWLQSEPYGPRQWAVETAPSLKQGADAVGAWYADGRLGPGDRGLHISADSAAAFAWFCPHAKGVRDDRLSAAFLGDPEMPADWARRMREERINHVIVYDADRSRLLAVLRQLLADPARWPLLHLEGDLAVFGWRDPEAKRESDAFRGQEVDLDRRAFRPTRAERAPGRRPDREPDSRRWWEALYKPAPARAIDRDAAELYYLQGEVLRELAPYRHATAWPPTQAAGLVAAAAGWFGPGSMVDAHARLVLFDPPQSPPDAADAAALLSKLAVDLRRPFVLNRDDTPSALLYMAIRAARRAVAANPQDAQAHLVLGRCYLRLLDSTRERVWSGRLPELGQLRVTQASAALNRAIALRPDLANAHRELGTLYASLGYLDLAVHHQRTYLKLVREFNSRRGGPTGAKPDEFAELEREFDRVARYVEEQQATFDRVAPGMRVYDRAALAERLGLGGKARDVLLESDIAAFGPQGVVLQLKILLRTGKVREVRDWTDPGHKSFLGPSYHWVRAMALAAAGDYALAEEECGELAAGGRDPSVTGPRQAMAAVVGQAVLSEHSAGMSLGHLFWQPQARRDLHVRTGGLATSIRQEADATVLRGLLALEAGDVDLAADDFRRALATWGGPADAESGAGIDFNGRVIAQGCLEWLSDE